MTKDVEIDHDNSDRNSDGQVSFEKADSDCNKSITDNNEGDSNKEEVERNRTDDQDDNCAYREGRERNIDDGTEEHFVARESSELTICSRSQTAEQKNLLRRLYKRRIGEEAKEALEYDRRAGNSWKTRNSVVTTLRK